DRFIIRFNKRKTARAVVIAQYQGAFRELRCCQNFGGDGIFQSISSVGYNKLGSPQTRSEIIQHPSRITFNRNLPELLLNDDFPFATESSQAISTSKADFRLDNQRIADKRSESAVADFFDYRFRRRVVFVISKVLFAR